MCLFKKKYNYIEKFWNKIKVNQSSKEVKIVVCNTKSKTR